MKLSRRFIVLVVATLLTGSLFLPATGIPLSAQDRGDALDRVEPLVLDQIAADGQTDFFIWLAEKADLGPAKRLQTKAEKGEFVYKALRETAERTQKDLRGYLDAQGADYRPFYISNKILVRGGDQTLVLGVASRPDVARITANHQFQLQEPVDKDANPAHITAVEPNISYINADDVWALGYDGAGTVLAGNDTGLDETHPAIAPHYRGCLNPPTCTTWDHNYNWWDATGAYPTNPTDGHGHGTHTTGTMVGDDYAGNQIGMAPGAQTIHCKNMTDGGGGSDATFTECFEWDLAPWDLTYTGFGTGNPRPDLAPHAVNNSWGYWDGNDPVFRDEIAALQAAGILVEVSAGNEGDDFGCQSLRSPGDYQEVLTTGSINYGSPYPGTVAAHSSRGPSDLDPGYFPDIMAPGEDVRSSLPDNSYASWGGTSMAGPHTTGLVGLMWSACSRLQGMVDETMQIIVDTATPLTGQLGLNCGGDYVTGPNHDWGFGTIDAHAAVQAALSQCAPPGALDGTIRDAVTITPLQDVVVTAEWDGGGQWQDSTDASGYYTMTLPNGAYTVTASLFGYLPETLTAVEVETGTVTTQDFYLDPAPEYLVSGVVTEEGTGTPLAAQVEVLDTPLPPVATNPSTGDYSISLPQGTYTLRVTAALHQPEERGIVADHSQTQDFALNPLPCILLVDDDNDDPDVRPHFTAALDNLGYSHETFNIGDGPGDGPDLASMQGHSIIIWFSGDKYSFSTPEAGPNSTDEANLAAYLDGGGKLFLSSQDYLWEMALTSFGQDYLGIGSYTNDSGNASTKHGVTGDPIGGGLGPYSLSYPTGFSDWGDVVNAGAGASVAFQSSAGGGNNLDVDKDGGAWQTVFFGTSWVPVYNGNAANGEEVLDRIIQWLGGCGECEPVHGATFDWTPPAPMVDENVTFTGAAAGTASFYYEWDLGDGYTGTGPSIMHAYAADGDYTVTMTATNSCGSDSTSDTITILTPPCDPVQVLDVLTTTNGCTVTFTADLAGDSPFAYDWDFGAFSSSTASAPTVDFGASGTYPYTLTVANCAGSESDTYMGEVTVTCEPPCDPVHGASYDWTPLTPIVGQEVVFTGAAAGTPSITYTWDFDDGSTGEGQVTPHAYAQEGTYTVVMTAANCVDQWVTAVQDVVVSPALVCTDVAGVDLALVTAGTIYTGSIVQFSAGITPDDAKPYSYTVDYGDGTVITDLSADGPLLLDHTYSATGTYQVEIDVWNCEIAPEDAVTGTLELTVYKQGVCVDLVGITISGDASGEPGVYTFTTTYTPTGASETITYTWDNGDAGDTTIRSLDVGIHTLVVTATNCADALVTDTHTIDISPAPDFYIYLPVIVRTP